MIEIDFKAFAVGCILGLIVAFIMIGLLMLVRVEDIYIIKDGVINPYFTGTFIVIVNVWATIDTPTKNYQEFKEAGFGEIHRDHKNMLAFYPCFSALIALISVLSLIINTETRSGWFSVISAAVLIIMAVGLSLACSCGIIKEAEKRQNDTLRYYLEDLNRK